MNTFWFMLFFSERIFFSKWLANSPDITYNVVHFPENPIYMFKNLPLSYTKFASKLVSIYGLHSVPLS